MKKKIKSVTGGLLKYKDGGPVDPLDPTAKMAVPVKKQFVLPQTGKPFMSVGIQSDKDGNAMDIYYDPYNQRSLRRDSKSGKYEVLPTTQAYPLILTSDPKESYKAKVSKHLQEFPDEYQEAPVYEKDVTKAKDKYLAFQKEFYGGRDIERRVRNEDYQFQGEQGTGNYDPSIVKRRLNQINNPPEVVEITPANSSQFIKSSGSHYDHYKHRVGLASESVDNFRRGSVDDPYSFTDAKFKREGVIHHELGHAIHSDPSDLGYGLDADRHIKKTIMNRLNTGQIQNGGSAHDFKDTEIKADMDAIRYKMYEDGIFIPNSNQRVTPEQMKGFKRKYKDDLMMQRQFDILGEDMMLKIINDYTATDTNDNIVRAATGGPITPEQEKANTGFLQNWYANRKITDPYLQGALDLDRNDLVNRSKSVPSPTYVDQVDPKDPNVTGRMTSDNKLLLSKNAPAHVDTHEKNHYINGFDSYTRSTNALVTQNELKSRDEMQGIYKDKYEYFSDPDEVHSRIMVMRQQAGFKPDQFIEEKDLDEYINNYKGDIDNVNDLYHISKDKKSLLNMLNFMVSNDARGSTTYAATGGPINNNMRKIKKYEWGGLDPALKGFTAAAPAFSTLAPKGPQGPSTAAKIGSGMMAAAPLLAATGVGAIPAAAMAGIGLGLSFIKKKDNTNKFNGSPGTYATGGPVDPIDPFNLGHFKTNTIPFKTGEVYKPSVQEQMRINRENLNAKMQQNRSNWNDARANERTRADYNREQMLEKRDANLEERRRMIEANNATRQQQMQQNRENFQKKVRGYATGGPVDPPRFLGRKLTNDPANWSGPNNATGPFGLRDTNRFTNEKVEKGTSHTAATDKTPYMWVGEQVYYNPYDKSMVSRQEDGSYKDIEIARQFTESNTSSVLRDADHIIDPKHAGNVLESKRFRRNTAVNPNMPYKLKGTTNEGTVRIYNEDTKKEMFLKANDHLKKYPLSSQPESSYSPTATFAYGGDMQLSNDSFQVQGNPQVTDGNRYQMQGQQVALDHNEVVSDMPQGKFVFSDKLKDPESKQKYSVMASKIEKSTGKAEKKLQINPYDPAAKATVAHNKGLLQDIANRQEMYATAMGLRNRPQDQGTQQQVRGYAGGGPIPYEGFDTAGFQKFAKQYGIDVGDTRWGPRMENAYGVLRDKYLATTGMQYTNGKYMPRTQTVQPTGGFSTSLSKDKVNPVTGEPYQAWMSMSVTPSNNNWSPGNIDIQQNMAPLDKLPQRGISFDIQDKLPYAEGNMLAPGVPENERELAITATTTAGTLQERSQPMIDQLKTVADPITGKPTNTVPEGSGDYKTPWTTGDYFKVAELLGKGIGAFGKPEREEPLLDTTHISQQSFDPTNALYNVDRQQRNFLNTVGSGAPTAGLRRAMQGSSLATGIGQKNQVLSQYQQMNQQAKGQYEDRVGQQRKFNVQSQFRTNEMNAQNRAAQDMVDQNFMTSIGQFGEDLNRKRYGSDIINYLRLNYPDVEKDERFMEILGIKPKKDGSK